MLQLLLQYFEPELAIYLLGCVGNEIVINSVKYQIHNFLSKGSHGYVYSVSTGREEYALKIQPYPDEDSEKELRNIKAYLYANGERMSNLMLIKDYAVIGRDVIEDRFLLGFSSNQYLLTVMELIHGSLDDLYLKIPGRLHNIEFRRLTGKEYEEIGMLETLENKTTGQMLELERLLAVVRSRSKTLDEFGTLQNTIGSEARLREIILATDPISVITPDILFNIYLGLHQLTLINLNPEDIISPNIGIKYVELNEATTIVQIGDIVATVTSTIQIKFIDIGGHGLIKETPTNEYFASIVKDILTHEEYPLVGERIYTRMRPDTIAIYKFVIDPRYKDFPTELMLKLMMINFFPHTGSVVSPFVGPVIWLAGPGLNNVRSISKVKELYHKKVTQVGREGYNLWLFDMLRTTKATKYVNKMYNRIHPDEQQYYEELAKRYRNLELTSHDPWPWNNLR